jgi:hypothetical protein
MDMNFTKVTFDGDLDDIEDGDELRTLVRKFESAQDANISEFETAKETLTDFEGRVGEAQEFKQELAETLSEVSPLSEDEAMDYDMARIRTLIGEFSDDGGSDESAEGESSFSDMGHRGETHSDDDESRNFAEEHLGSIKGLNF